MSKDKFRSVAAKVLSRRPDLAARLKAAGVGIDQIERIAAARHELTEGVAAAAAPALVAPSLPPSVIPSVESIIEEVGRPTLFVTGDDYELPLDEDLARRLKSARSFVSARLRSVGRVEVFDGTIKWPVGTAWMIADGVVITNRHVAEKFATLGAGGKPVLLTDLRNRPYKVFIDFREEHGSIEESEMAVESVLYLPQRNAQVSDIALLRMAPNDKLPPPIPLLASKLAVDSWVAVVGYPQPDDRIPPEARAVEEAYFANVYGVKRLSPGQIDAHAGGMPAWLIAHDATTLGGNSGSVLIDLATGSAAGIHFKGEFKKANYAVHCEEIRRVLVESRIAFASAKPPAPPASDEVAVPAGADEAAENLDAFAGYVANFIDPDKPTFKVEMPEITANAPGSIAELKGGRGKVLKYRNFSVVMNKARRLCYFSAVNIDGANTFNINGARPRWRFDTRLDEELQIKDECYGPEDDGKFSRGHMTRREDPNWGRNREEATISNRHTFFVPNACPQVQPFNAPIWLGLEDYALENADQDDMRISVFTGPVFTDNDPEYFGVKVPVDFWKIIVFKHDATGKLSATGYTMSQRNLLPSDDEFVFGQFDNRQVTIRHIERLTGLSFHQLREHDPFDDDTESLTVRRLRSSREAVFA